MKLKLDENLGRRGAELFGETGHDVLTVAERLKNDPKLAGGMPRYLIWDFDGTLGFRHGNWSGALVEVLQRADPSCGVTREHFVPHLQTGFPWHDPQRKRSTDVSPDDWWDALQPVFIRAFAGVGLTHSRAEQLARDVRAAYLDAAKLALFDDALPALERLSREGWTHVILSNHVPEFRQILDVLGVQPLIERIFNSAETGVEKPHPDAFRNVLDAVEAGATVWMIGDNLRADIEGAAAAGIPAVLVRKHHPAASFQCDSLERLSSIVSRSAID